MKRLCDIKKAWRDYLYAYDEGEYNDADELLSRVEIISECHEDIIKNILKHEPDMEEVDKCREEILFQRAGLEKLTREFIKYLKNNFIFKEDIMFMCDSMLEGFCNDGTRDSFYITALDWEQLAREAQNIWISFNVKCAGKLCFEHDEFIKLTMDGLLNIKKI